MVGGISHDLRTPVNGISILLNTVLKIKKLYKLPEKIIEEYIKPSISICDLLVCLINDIMDFT